MAVQYRPGRAGRLERKRQLLPARGRRDLRRRPPRETGKRPGQMGLIRVPGLTRHVGRGTPRHSSSTARSARRICPMAPRVRPVARDTRRCTERVDRPSTSPANAAGTTGSCTSSSARISLSTKTSALSGSGNSIWPIEPERRPRGPRQRQRTVNQLSGRQARHERAQAELDPEKLRIPRDRRRRRLRLGSSDREPGRPPLTGDDDLPMTHRHRDEGLLGLTSCLPRLLDQGRA